MYLEKKAVLQYQTFSYVLLYAMGIVGGEAFFSLCIFQCGASSAFSNTRDESGTLLAHCMYKFPCASIRVPRKIDVFSLTFIVWLNILIGTVTCIENGISRVHVKDLFFSS